ncbi:MAG: Xaa-Pro peptidase family protein [Chlamydiales bacterium]|nr:Xaa-Pro peptidase family protein [Chlamydiales bacterium]
MFDKIHALREQLSRHQLEALLIENPVDLLYLTGMSLSKGSFVVTEHSAELFVDGRYLAAAQKNSPVPVLPSEKNAFAKDLKGRVGFDSAWMCYDAVTGLQKKIPSVQWTPVSMPLKEMRGCKGAEEIAMLKQAAALTKEGILHIEGLLKEGVSEEDLAFAFEQFCRKKGASSLSFEPIIAFGEHSAYPHHRAGKALLKKGQHVLMDVGAVWNHYRGDLTRVAFFGEVDPQILYLSETVRNAQQKAIEAIRPGVLVGRLDEIVRDEFRQVGLESYFTHSLGHGVGLETHEFPRIKYDGEDAKVPLKAGMVITIEPGIYQPGVGGIRYEEMVLVTPDGHEIC